MAYRPGDHVFPTDLPRRFMCRVLEAESIDGGSRHGQILKLKPLEGPWPSGTFLIRFDSAVVPVGVRGLWQRRPRIVASVFARYRRPRVVRCPETGEPARVQIDAPRAAASAIPGPPELHVAECSRWPERRRCAQACLAAAG